MMKIAFVLDDTLDTSDGVQQHIILLGDWLTRHGHEVHYLTSRSSRTDITHLHDLGKHWRLKFNRNVVPLVLPTSPRAISAILEREQFDVLHVQMPYSPAFGARIIALAPQSTAIVGTFHIAPYSWAEKTFTSVLGYWLKPTIDRIDEIISVSQPAQLLAKQSFKRDSKIIPNMVDVASFKLVKKLNQHKPSRLVFLGRLVERKGCEHFIRSLALLTEPYEAVIVGDGNQRAQLEKLVAKLHLQSKITFAGFVSEQKKRQILSKADIAVFPSTGGESFGIVLIEAMAAGSCVVLGGDNPGYSTVLGAVPESIVQPKNHQAFAETLQSFMTDSGKLQRTYDAQQQLVRRYDVNNVAPQILKTYQAAIAKHAKSPHTTR